MAAKVITGAEFKRYLNDKSPDCWGPDDGTIYVDESVLEINGEETEAWGEDTIADTDVIRITGGYIGGMEKKNGDPVDMTFDQHFKKWRKKQTTGTLLVEYDTSNPAVLQALLAAIKAAGGKVK